MNNHLKPAADEQDSTPRRLLLSIALACTFLLVASPSISHAATIGGMPDQSLTAWAWDGPNLQPFRSALEDPANFGPDGTFLEPVTTVTNLDATAENLVGLDVFVSSWWPDTDASAEELNAIREYFLNGGNLLLMQDDTNHDPVGAFLGIPTAGNSGFSPSNDAGGSPLHDGPFGTASNVKQHYTKGFLDAATIAANNGTVSSIRGTGEITAAFWDAGDYAPGAGRLVILADVDMCGQTALSAPGNPEIGDGAHNGADYDPLDANGIFCLNAISYLLGGIPPEGDPLLLQAADTLVDNLPATRVSLQITGGVAGGVLPDVEILTASSCVDGVLVMDETAASLGVITAPTNQIPGELPAPGEVDPPCSGCFDANGNAFLVETLAGAGAQYASARLVNGPAAGDASACVVAGPDNDTWTRAKPIVLGSDPVEVKMENGFIDVPGRTRWYKFVVQPNSQATIELSNLPANYDLVLFKDIEQAFVEIAEGDDSDTEALDRLGAEFASTPLNTTEISPFAFSPAEISPFAFSPFAFSPFAFSSSVYAGDAAVAPFAFSPFAFSASANSPFAFSPFAFSPFAFSAADYSPFAFSPFAFSDAYSSAQSRSVIGVSSLEGTTTERISSLTWNNTGNFYIRVAGDNGAASDQQSFELTLTYEGGLCAGLNNAGPVDIEPLTTVGFGGNFRSLILYDSARLLTDGHSQQDVDALRVRLDNLKNRPEVAGEVVDLGGFSQIGMLHADADEYNGCPYAENLVAAGIKTVIDSYRAENPDLEYVVLAGSDGQIPYFRYPDQTQLGPESQYEPPVKDFTQSQSALRLNYVLGQDEYGAATTLSLGDGQFPVPDLAVGRLVETPAEMIAVLDAYLSTEAGIVQPGSTLVTGYDFLYDTALAIQDEFVAGTNALAGARNETLLAASDLAPEDPGSWNADLLSQRFLDQTEDVVFLAGHFNAFSALAADYQTTLDTTDVLASSADFTNALIFSAGCHSGYNAVNEEQVEGLPLDWPQTFARKGATFIGGTGYQYGDTEFIEFSERLYLEFARELRTGDGPVSVGKALIAAKQKYLSDETEVKGLHRKSLLISALFGLPMMQVDMPGERIPDGSTTSVVDNFAPVGANPGATLGLQTAELSLPDLPAQLAEVTKPLTVYTPDGSGGATVTSVTASYLDGLDGLVINPGEPVIPRRSLDVSVAGQSLRGIGFRGGSWTDESGILPLTGAATTELRAPQTRFASLLYYPMQLARPNYYGALTGNGKTILHITPVQHRVEQIGQDAIRRTFSNLEYRLYYSDNTVRYLSADGASTNIPALSAAPSISEVQVELDGNDLVFTATVVGDPAAGIQEVWVTYTDSSSSSGTWVAEDLEQTADTRIWSKRLIGGAPGAGGQVDAIFHAANGVGLVSSDDNFGQFHQASVAGVVAQDTAIAFSGEVPTSAPSGSSLSVAAALTDAGGSPLADQTVVFTLGNTVRSAMTDTGGVADVSLPAVNTPGDYPLTAAFNGTSAYNPSSIEARFMVDRAATQLTLTAGTPSVEVDGIETAVTAQLNVDNAELTPLIERTVFFTIIGGPDGAITIPKITDFQGIAELGEVALPAGTYTVEARFLGVIPNVLDVITDPVYLKSEAQPTPITLANGTGCPTASKKGKISVSGFCYLTNVVDGKVAITNGTLVVGGSTQIIETDGTITVIDGVVIDQKIDQYGNGGVNIMAGASVRGQIKESGAGSILVAGDVGGNLTETGPGDISISSTGTLDGQIKESDDGDVTVAGSVDGNTSERGSGNLTITVDGSIDGHATESGPGILVNDGSVSGNVEQD